MPAAARTALDEAYASMAADLHDVNNSLGVVISYIDLMTGETGLSPAMQDSLAESMQASLKVAEKVARVQQVLRTLRAARA